MKINSESLNPKFLLKLRALVKGTITKYITDGDSRNLDEYSPIKQVLKTLIIASGATLLIRNLGMKYLVKLISSKDIEASDRLRKALQNSHTPKQKQLWEEIQRSQKEKGSLTEEIKTSIFNEGNSTTVSYLSLLATLFLSKKDRFIKSKTKWLGIQIRKYEDSLNNNQLVIYKNLFETDLKILSRTRILKSILYVGVPLVAYHLVAHTQRKNIKEWEKAINH